MYHNQISGAKVVKIRKTSNFARLFNFRMKITFLGTGTSQGVPVIGCKCDVCTSPDERDKRLRSSALVETDGYRLLIDAGPDFRQQLLRADVADLSAILLTHEHKDHTGGLDDVRALNYLAGAPMDVYAESRVLDAVRAEYSYAFVENPYPGTPEMNLHEIRCDETFSVGRVGIVPLRVFHHKLPILGFRIGDLVYVTDANGIDRSELEKMRGCRLLVLNALRKREHLAHFSLAQALDVARRVGAQRTLLTHVSHLMGKHGEVESELPPTVELARDGLTVVISD